MPGSTTQHNPHLMTSIDTPRLHLQKKEQSERKDESSEGTNSQENSKEDEVSLEHRNRKTTFAEDFVEPILNDIFTHRQENTIELDYRTASEYRLHKLFSKESESSEGEEGEEEEETKENIQILNNNDTSAKQRYITLIPPHMLIITKKELKAYKRWLKEVIKAPESEYAVSLPTVRLSIFLQFFRMNFPIEEIVANNFGSAIDWRNKNRRVHSTATLVHIPLDKNYSSLWWCTSKPLPSCIQDFGYTFICHTKQTHLLPYPMARKERVKDDKLNFTLSLMKNQPIPLLTSFDPKLRNARDEHINWALEYVINSSSKIPQLLKIRAARALSALVWPEETVTGLLDKLWSTGAALRILNMARQAEIEVHKHISINDIQIEHAIGQGAVGKVYSALYQENSVAVKTCSESNPAFNEEEFRFEVALMCILRHPNILTCIGANTSEFFFVSPYQCHGTLRAVLDNNITLSSLRKLSIAYQIACGMNYLHKYHFIHRDLKSDNILLDECWNVKINDFGTSRLHGIIDFTRKDNMIGTREWMAPEMYEENFEYDEKVDVYSFGIVLYELFTGKYPYYEIEKKYQIGDHVLQGGRPIFANEDIAFDRIKVLMKKCWHSKSSKRPSFQSIEEKLSSLLSLVKERESGMRRKKQQFNIVNTLRRVSVNFDMRRKPEPLNSNLQVVNSGLGLPSLDQFQSPTTVGIGIAPSKSY